MTQVCRDCKEEKPIDMFRQCESRVRLGRISKRCFECRMTRLRMQRDKSLAGLRRCSACRETKSKDEFSPTSEKYLSHQCKKCAASYHDRKRRAEGRKKVRKPHEIGTEEEGFTCSSCRTRKPVTEYSKRRQGTHWKYVCKQCACEKHAVHKSKPEVKFRYAQKLAVKRKLPWSLTFEQFTAIVANPCHYCEHPLPKSACGIDRKDSRLGYTPENSVPCCTECTIAKGPFWSYEEMLVIGQAIASLKSSRLTSGTPESSRGWGGASHR